MTQFQLSTQRSNGRTSKRSSDIAGTEWCLQVRPLLQ